MASSRRRFLVTVGTAAGGAAALSGLGAAFALDTPAGPTIVCAAAVIFALTVLLGRLRTRSAAGD